MTRPIFLVGMPGSGKSTVGRRLAARLDRPFIDADHEIEARCGVSIATIFDIEGEAGFRERETRVLQALAEQRDVIVATGGGAVLRPVNRRLLRENGVVLYLDASLGELWNRLRHDRRRPLLRGDDPRGRLAALLEQRRLLYESVATMPGRSRRQPIERFVGDIMQVLESQPQASACPQQGIAQGDTIELGVALAERSYPILIGEGLLERPPPRLLELVAGRQVAIISN
ncbi:MAG: shikimate kinase [Burkholderiaceae bacterium]